MLGKIKDYSKIKQNMVGPLDNPNNNPDTIRKWCGNKEQAN